MGPDIEESLGIYPNQMNSFKRDLEKVIFPKKWSLECISPVEIIFSSKTKMVRMVHMNTFGRMDLEKMEVKSQDWGETVFQQSSREL